MTHSLVVLFDEGKSEPQHIVDKAWRINKEIMAAKFAAMSVLFASEEYGIHRVPDSPLDSPRFTDKKGRPVTLEERDGSLTIHYTDKKKEDHDRVIENWRDEADLVGQGLIRWALRTLGDLERKIDADINPEDLELLGELFEKGMRPSNREAAVAQAAIQRIAARLGRAYPTEQLSLALKALDQFLQPAFADDGTEATKLPDGGGEGNASPAAAPATPVPASSAPVVPTTPTAGTSSSAPSSHASSSHGLRGNSSEDAPRPSLTAERSTLRSRAERGNEGIDVADSSGMRSPTALYRRLMNGVNLPEVARCLKLLEGRLSAREFEVVIRRVEEGLADQLTDYGWLYQLVEERTGERIQPHTSRLNRNCASGPYHGTRSRALLAHSARFARNARSASALRAIIR